MDDSCAKTNAASAHRKIAFRPELFRQRGHETDTMSCVEVGHVRRRPKPNAVIYLARAALVRAFCGQPPLKNLSELPASL